MHLYRSTGTVEGRIVTSADFGSQIPTYSTCLTYYTSYSEYCRTWYRSTTTVEGHQHLEVAEFCLFNEDFGTRKYKWSCGISSLSAQDLICGSQNRGRGIRLIFSYSSCLKEHSLFQHQKSEDA